MGIKQGFFSGAHMPKFHKSMLVVKVRAAAAPAIEAAVAPMMQALTVRSRRAATALSAGAARGGEDIALADIATIDRPREIFASPGMNLLERYERGGLIKRVTALAPDVMTTLPAHMTHGVLTTFAMSNRQARGRSHGTGRSSNAGVNIVELQRDEDTVTLQKALAEDPHIEFVARVPMRYLLATRRAPTRARTQRAAPQASTMWNLHAIRWAQARAAHGFTDANHVNVAVLDTGIDKDHPDLRGRVVRYTYLHPDTPAISGERDIIGHGTHVSGTIGAVIGNRRGINGICECRLNMWKIFPDAPEYSADEDDFEYFVDPVMYQRALADCIDQDIDVMNLSIGGSEPPDPQERQLFEQLMANGTTVVAAMGNEREEGSPTSYPAAIPGVIAVGATSITDRVTTFSNRGDHISVCAPGKGIWSTLPTYPGQSGFAASRGPNGKPIEGKPFKRETDYDDWDGTSMASPHVAAAMALLIAKAGKMAPEKCRKELIDNCDVVPAMHGKKFDSDYGFGRLNLERMLK